MTKKSKDIQENYQSVLIVSHGESNSWSKLCLEGWSKFVQRQQKWRQYSRQTGIEAIINTVLEGDKSNLLRALVQAEEGGKYYTQEKWRYSGAPWKAHNRVWNCQLFKMGRWRAL